MSDHLEVEGDEPVTIGKNTAVLALAAMKAQAEAGKYRELMADDASFVRAAIRELARIVEGGEQ